MEDSYVFTKDELAKEAGNLYSSFSDLLESDPTIKNLIRENESERQKDFDFPEEISFSKGDIIYNFSLKILKDGAGNKTGKELYLLRFDNNKNEEQVRITVGNNPAVDYRKVLTPLEVEIKR